MVIFIDGEKYAWYSKCPSASCIRGHRVKKCNHNDRQLVPLVKRGRQVSQCTHCRDLRKTNGTHVKCTCAIASTPNPINGCLCEVINSCTCVASHLQEVQDNYSTSSNSVYSQSPSVSEKSLPANPLSTSNDNNNIPIISQQNASALIDDVDLMNFLENDLDKFIAMPDPTFTASTTDVPEINQDHTF